LFLSFHLHLSGCHTLSKLKLEHHELIESGGQIDPHSMKQQSQAYSLTMSSIVKIPEKKFNRLKASHKRKVLLSKMIDANPGSSLLMLRLSMWLRVNRKLFADRSNTSAE